MARLTVKGYADVTLMMDDGGRLSHDLVNGKSYIYNKDGECAGAVTSKTYTSIVSRYIVDEDHGTVVYYKAADKASDNKEEKEMNENTTSTTDTEGSGITAYRNLDCVLPADQCPLMADPNYDCQKCLDAHPSKTGEADGMAEVTIEGSEGDGQYQAEQIPPKAEEQPTAVKRGEIVIKEQNRSKLTDLQKAFISNMDKDGFFERGLDSALWSDIYADTLEMENIMNKMQAGAMVTTLRQKGLIVVGVGAIGKRTKAKYFELTDSGKELAVMLRPEWGIGLDNEPHDAEKPEYAVGDVVKYAQADKRARFTITAISNTHGHGFLYDIKGNKGEFVANENELTVIK